ncbi:MAG TPA: hypothetical protein VMH78_04845 [Thermoplasmata archaeon]|nr:hypothetical protein [Thermoplasmata archaeon]
MAHSATPFRTPYTATPGTSTQPPGVTPEEGRRELWGFFWLSLANTAIIAVTCVAIWWFVH